MRLILLSMLLALAVLPARAQDQALPGAEEQSMQWGEVVEQDGDAAAGDEKSARPSKAEQIFGAYHYDPEQLAPGLREFSEISPAGQGQESLQLLRDILASDEFQQAVQPQVQNPGLAQRIINWFNRTLSSIAQAMGVGTAGGGILLYVLIVLALALLAMLIRQVLMAAGGSGSRKLGREIDEDDPDLDLLALAEQSARLGDFRTALRYRFLAVLRGLDLPASTLTTNSMLVRRIRSGHPEMHGDFSRLVQIFEDAWYGSLDFQRADYSEAAGIAGSLDARIRLSRERAK